MDLPPTRPNPILDSPAGPPDGGDPGEAPEGPGRDGGGASGGRPPGTRPPGILAPGILATGTLAPGAWVGRFRVEGALGQGGMGAVYRVWDPVLERSLALKAIRFGEDGLSVSRERFRREAMALAKLNHPNVCQVHDWVEWEGSAFIAMELVEGETLADAASGLDLAGKLKVLRAVARALEAAHAKGIVHRDLKPGNVMVDGLGQVKVLDFGLARLVGEGGGLPDEPTAPDGRPASGAPVGEGTSLTPFLAESVTADGPPMDGRSTGILTVAGSFMGSPAYASPEQMQGRNVGPPSDIFSLGVMAWEVLLGDHPFPGRGRKRMEATCAGGRKPLRGRKVSRRLAALLQSLLERDAHQRPTARAAGAALDRLVSPSRTGAWVAGGLVAAVCSLSLAYAVTHRSIIADLGRDRPPRLASLPVLNESGDPSINALVEVGLTELLSTALRDSPRLSVLDAESVTRVQAAFRASPSADPSGRERIRRSLGAALVLEGRVRREPGSGRLALAYTLTDAGGRVRLAGSVLAPEGRSFTPFSLADPAAAQLLAKVDPLRSPQLHGAAIPPETFATYAAGKALFLQGDFKGSEPLLREAAYQAPSFAVAVAAYASCLRRLGREQALAVANWSLMASRATGDRWAEGRALGVKAYLAKDRGDLDEAEQLRRSTLGLAEATRDLDGASVACNHLGLIAVDRGRSEEARARFSQSLAWSERTGDQLNVALAQNNLGNLALKEGDLAGATALYRSNLAIQQALGNRWGAGLALNNLGVTALTARDLPAAEAHLARALAIRADVGDRAGQSTCLRNLGILCLMREDLGQAEAYQRRSLVLAEASGQRSTEAETRFCMGELHRLQKRFKAAMEEYQRVEDLLTGGLTPEIRMSAQAALAECESRLPAPRLAEASRRLLALGASASESPYVHRARAWVHFQGGRTAEALRELEAAREDPRRQAPEIRGELDRMRALFQGR